MQEQTTANGLAEQLKALPGTGAVTIKANEVCFCNEVNHLLPNLAWLKQTYGFDLLIDATAVDQLMMASQDGRYELVCLLGSSQHYLRVRIKAKIGENETVPTITGLYGGADWAEREIFDMFGIVFDGHPALQRILLGKAFVDYPLRKDYPVEGRGERNNFCAEQLTPEEVILFSHCGNPQLSSLSKGEEQNSPPLNLPHQGGGMVENVHQKELVENTPQKGGIEGSPPLVGPVRGGGETKVFEVTYPDQERLLLNMGPQHPSMHGTLRIVVELEGETIVKCRPDLGYLHCGFEKQAEVMTYNQYIVITDRMNYLSPLTNNITYCLAVEKLMGLEIPARAVYLRVILAELNRIADHLLWLGTHGLDLGAFTVFLYAFQRREEIYDLTEYLSGARYTPSFTRVGGLMADVPDDFKERTHAIIEKLLPTLDEIETLLTRNRIYVDRTRGVGVLTAEQALSTGVTGPVLRASGVARDLRAGEPHMFYDRFEFEIPYGENGDVYDRYLVRMEEFRQSCRIIEQAMAQMEPGPVIVDDFKVAQPPKDRVYRDMEAMIHHFKTIMDGHEFHAPAGAEAYGATESPNGELGFYLVSDGRSCPYRCRVRGPSFYNYQALPYMVEGAMLSDLVAILGSLNIIAGELDR